MKQRLPASSTCQGQVSSQLAPESREKESAADVGEKTDGGLRHREKRLLRRQAEATVDGQTHAAAHRNPV